MLCSEPAVPGQSLNASLCPPVLPFQATPEQGCQLGLALPGMHTQGCGDHVVLPAAELELFLWEGDKSQLGGPTSCAASMQSSSCWKGEVDGSGVTVPGSPAIII